MLLTYLKKSMCMLLMGVIRKQSMDYDMPLMRNQLRTHTRKIRYDDAAAERALERLSPGRTTAEAVERGCTLMLRGFVLTQLELARSYWGDDFTVFLTGGDADLVSDAVPQARLIPDLVFVGLAMACPLS